MIKKLMAFLSNQGILSRKLFNELANLNNVNSQKKYNKEKNKFV